MDVVMGFPHEAAEAPVSFATPIVGLQGPANDHHKNNGSTARGRAWEIA